MPKVLTSASIITCAHQGKVTPKPGQTKLAIDGKPALQQSNLIGAPIVGCSQIGPGLTPCTSILAVTVGLAVNLSIDGQPVLLETAAGQTNGAPVNLWKAQAAGQIKLGSG